jgi:pyruvate dehydrogenase E2 component (dihydrolipoamide acetyltransferase)
MDVKVPHLGEGADSGTVVSLLVKEGDAIVKDQPVIELENEKAVATIPSTCSGTVARVLVKVGDKVSVGQRILSVASAGGPEPAPAPARDRRAEPQGQPEPAGESEAGSSAEAEAAPATAPASSPAIRKLARDLGLDLTRVRGSARGGRIVLADLRAYVQRLQKAAAGPKPAPEKAAPERIDFSKWGPVSRKPLSSLRQVISRRMLENWQSIPHVTQFDDADLTALLALRKRHVAAYEQRGARLTVTAFILKAVVDTLRKHPAFNSSLDEAAQELVFKEYYHIGIAVDTDAGLIVPVIRDADKKSVLDLSRELDQLAARTRDRKVTGDELKGGTFTISNQGGIGGGPFTPIINKPEVAILGLGRGAARPVARGDGVEVRTLLPLSLSYDHRVIDGGQAARFITDLAAAIETFDEAAVKL